MRINIPDFAHNVKAVCIFHSADMDGKTAGFCVNLYQRLAHKDYEETSTYFLGANYEKDFNVDDIINAFPNTHTFFIVDYSIPVDQCLKLLSFGFTVHWYDHHKSAIDDYLNNEYFILGNKVYENAKEKYLSGIYELECILECTGKFISHVAYNNCCSGTYLTFSALFIKRMVDFIKLGMLNEHTTILTQLINRKLHHICRLVSTYDIWNHDDDEYSWEEALAFNTAIRMKNFHPVSDLWWRFGFDGVKVSSFMTVEELIKEGRSILEYIRSQNEITSNSYGGTLEFEGYTFCTVNAANNSTLVDSIFDPTIHDAVLLYIFKPKENMWKVSMYSNDNLSDKQKEELDLTPIAIKYGGGGHKGACGFSCKELPFDIYSIIPIFNPKVDK